MRYLALLMLVSVSACDASVVPSEGGGGAAQNGGASSDGGGGADAAGGAGGAPACTRNEIPLELTIVDGIADSQVVPVTYDGIDGWLAIDTGAWVTLVFGKEGDPEYIPYVGDAQIGCETVPMALMTLDAIGVEMFQGKPIIGILGLDFFKDRPAEIDYPGGRVVRYVSGDPITDDLFSVDAEFTEYRVVVESGLDDTPLRLVYDAGSPNTLWVGVPGEPGDEAISLGTADGSEVTVYEGSAELTLGADDPRTITVWRTMEFPYMQRELDQLAADGLLGASGMGFRRILFDSADETVWLGPL